MRHLLAMASLAFSLGACANGTANHGPASTRSGVQVYGTIDAGVGSQNISR